MARMLSHLHSAIRGSVGGITYLANGFHAIVARNRVSPTNPMSQNQTYVRSAMSAGNQLWEALDEIERVQWKNFADTIQYTGPLGDYSVPGRQIALGTYNLAMYLHSIGCAEIDTPYMEPPFKAGLLPFPQIEVTLFEAIGTGFSFSVFNLSDEDIILAGWLSLKQSDARYTYKGPWYPGYFKYFPISANTLTGIAWDDLPADGIYFAKFRAISQDGPRRFSPSFIWRCEAITNEA